jgi:hypothetical protein
MVVLNFTKIFTRGIMAGMQICEQMHFVDKWAALRWVGAINCKHFNKQNDYQVANYCVEEEA